MRLVQKNRELWIDKKELAQYSCEQSNTEVQFLFQPYYKTFLKDASVFLNDKM